MYNNGVPIAKFSWFDNSAATTDTLFSVAEDGLCVPFFFLMTERGTPGAIEYGAAAELYPILGSYTFDESSPFFNKSTLFAGKAMAGQGVNVMRMVDPNATTATMGLFLEVIETDIVQYTKDSNGARVVDTNGDFIPLLESDNVTEVVEPGVKVKWTVRVLAPAETYKTLTVKTVVDGATTTTIYPVMGFDLSSPGSYGNRQGFSLYSTRNENAAVASDINSVLYRFVPLELPTVVSATASAITDIYGYSSADVSFKDVAVYSKTNTNYSFKYTIGNNYYDVDSEKSLLPYDVFVYGENIKTVGQLVLTKSPELGDIDPYMIDLIAAIDEDGNEYDHIEVDVASSTVVNSNVINYASGGSDGDTSFAKLQELIRDWLSGSDHGEFTNLQQHPMTHFDDPGFSIDTKYLLFNMLDLRDNFKVSVSTQDASLAPNTKAQDLSAGQALLFRAQMHPESTINGVGCTRAAIYAHTADLISGSPYTGSVPFTLNRLIQRRDLDGGRYIKGSSAGLPNSQVTLFRKPNWVADDESMRALFWASCINTVQHASRKVIFYSSLRTVYPNDTSLLSDDEISDRIIYMFKICRAIWAKYAGVRQPKEDIYPLIEKDIDNECAEALNGDDVTVKSTVFQTAMDENLGYAISVNLDVRGNFPIRQFNINVIVGRASA